jgi:hypothetical protein
VFTVPAVTLVVSAACVPSASAAVRPSLRLFGSARQVTVTQNDLRFGTADLGLWIASVNGGFQIDVRRPGYGAWSASQVDAATAAPLRSIPAGLADPARGLRRFLSVQFADARGRIAARRQVTFCPNGQASRVNDSGPLNSTYLSFCQGFSSFPFVRGVVWGIDAGWAVPPVLGSGSVLGFPIGALPPGPLPPGVLPPTRGGWVSLKPGRYTAIVSITRQYRKLFGIAAGQAATKVKMRVLYSPPQRVRPSAGPPRSTKPEDAGDAGGPQVVPTVTAPEPASMPNLVAAPAWGITIRRQGGSLSGPVPISGTGGRARRPLHDILTFSATIWNAGPAPFSIEGFRRPHSDVMDAYEYFFDLTGNVVGRAPAGSLQYDARRGHNHWHLRQLASYELVGRSRTIISQKQSFCIAPTDPVDLTMPGAQESQVALGFDGTVCDLFEPGAIWIREQLPAGWGDTYVQAVAGQAFDITNVPNGSYQIAVRVNPLGLLHETRTQDDLAVRRIRLLGRRGARRVEVAPWHGING